MLRISRGTPQLTITITTAPADHAITDEASVCFVRSMAACVHSPPMPSRSATTCWAAAELPQPAGSGATAHHHTAATPTSSDHPSNSPMNHRTFAPTKAGRSPASITSQVNMK